VESAGDTGQQLGVADTSTDAPAADRAAAADRAGARR
jgi:hypothetical protein